MIPKRAIGAIISTVFALVLLVTRWPWLGLLAD